MVGWCKAVNLAMTFAGALHSRSNYFFLTRDLVVYAHLDGCLTFYTMNSKKNQKGEALRNH